ncbi:hypothetical protein EVAR_42976_1 [Eumeta japonica]|uniref:Uncharacterized protein n=1 Tax=Eumeta variegata TaxID=151549 RepID=A0A4C1WDN7_EUMVA|nr:hypothetical protein EVAR_42976_1 [Eumeta japonica]
MNTVTNVLSNRLSNPVARLVRRRTPLLLSYKGGSSAKSNLAMELKHSRISLFVCYGVCSQISFKLRMEIVNKMMSDKDDE